MILICLCASPSQAVTYTIHDLGAMTPYAINNLGQIAGIMTAADGTYHGFFWQNGQMTDLVPAWRRESTTWVRWSVGRAWSTRRVRSAAGLPSGKAGV